MAHDATFYQGEKVVINVNVVDQDGVAKDLTGGSVAWRYGEQVSEQFGAAIAGALGGDPTTGAISVTLSAVNTAAIPAKQWDHQFIVTDSDGDIQVVRDGTILVKKMLPAS